VRSLPGFDSDAGSSSRRAAYVIGEQGIVDELASAGISALGGPADAGRAVDLSVRSPIQVDDNIGAVVVGVDRHINYYKLTYASLCLTLNPGCVFVATNEDSRGHFTQDQEWPGAGCAVGALRGAVPEVAPVVTGKPAGFMIEDIRRRVPPPPTLLSALLSLCAAAGAARLPIPHSSLPPPRPPPPPPLHSRTRTRQRREHGFAPDRMVIVGDRLDTDIEWGAAFGLTSLCVLTGVTSEAALLAGADRTAVPDAVLDSLADLLTVEAAARAAAGVS
jgi:phosphoglycolate phosphatase